MKQLPSRKIAVLGVICTLLVVYIHATTFRICDGADDTSAVALFNGKVQSTIAFGIARVAVPFFFLISGALFFRNADSYADILNKIKRRISTLVLPYLLWSGLWVAVLLLAGVFGFSNDTSAAEKETSSVYTLLNTWLLDPFPGQLWFVRDLIVISFLSPLFFVLVKQRFLISPILFLLLWIFVPETVVIESRAPYEFVSLTGIAMFFCGGWLSRHVTAIKLPAPAVCCAALFWICLAVIRTCNPWDWSALDSEVVDRVLDRVCILFGLVTLWFGFPCIDAILKRSWSFKFSQHSFFVFVAHYPLLKILMTVVVKLGDCNPVVQLLTYVMMPILLTAFLYCLASFAAKRFPKIYGPFSGFRGLTNSSPSPQP